jgi:hypothetical protein
LKSHKEVTFVTDVNDLVEELAHPNPKLRETIKNPVRLPITVEDRLSVQGSDSSTDDYVAELYTVQKTAGLRPFDSDFNFTAAALPAQQNKEVSKASFDQMLKAMGPWRDSATLQYIYLNETLTCHLTQADRSTLNSAINQSLKKGAKIPTIDANTKQLEVVSYSGLGVWVYKDGEKWHIQSGNSR